MKKVIDLVTEDRQVPEIPQNVRYLLGHMNTKWLVSGTEVSFSSCDSDYGTVKEWKEFTEYFAAQFGGKVCWDGEQGLSLDTQSRGDWVRYNKEISDEAKKFFNEFED